MKSSTKIIALVLLVAFFGLLTLGTIVDKPARLSQHSNGIDCFGTGCGPIEHVVLHTYLVADADNEGKYIESYHQNFVSSDSLHQSPEITKESPPPKISLV